MLMTNLTKASTNETVAQLMTRIGDTFEHTISLNLTPQAVAKRKRSL